ncbi:MAG: hypothetical protein R2932_40615 [Caldilineaceae bacterium]
MLDAIIIMCKSRTCIVRGIDACTLHLPCELLFQRLECQQVIAKDEAVVEVVIVALAVGGVVRALGIFDQDARFQPGALLLADPGQFEFWFGLGHGLPLSPSMDIKVGL